MQRGSGRIFAVVLALAGTASTQASADEVTKWTQIMLTANHTAGASAPVASRNAAIVEGSIFDAVNGVKGLYTPLHVEPAAPEGTSERAAAVQAAYVSLMHLYPAQAATFNEARSASLAEILKNNGGANHQQKLHESVDAGIAWGQQVADDIWNWRLTDGLTPPPAPFLGDTNTGDWRPTPTAFAPGAVPQFATMTPWILLRPGQFRPAGPPALGSALYAQVFNETKTMGKSVGSPRTADQTLLVQFWQSTNATYFWNAVALRLTAGRDVSLRENARLFAALNVAIADSVIASWDAKYYFHSWRPVTAIALADTDGNLATSPDPSWNPLVPTPNHPEYPSAHSSFSAGGVAVLVATFGEDIAFAVDSDAMPGVTRSFTSFDAALAELADARVFGGIHFRTACDDGKALGTAVGNYVLQNSFRPGKGKGTFDEEDN
jgi:hypothetical protein